MSVSHELSNGPTDAISALSFSPSGSRLAVASWDQSITIYQRKTSDPDSPNGPIFSGLSKVFCRGPILDICWARGTEDEEDNIYFVGLDHTVRRVNIKGPNGTQEVLSTHEKPSNKIVYSAEHGLLISTSWDGTMHIHNLQGQRHVRVRLAAKPFAIALTDERVVVAMAGRKVSIYELATLAGAVEREASSEVLDVEPWQRRESSLKFQTRAVACMPDGTGFATSSIEGRVSVEWFAESRQGDTYAFKCHRKTEKTTVTRTGSNGDQTATETTEEIDVVYPVNALTFHPVYGTFATGGGDGLVAFWDAQTKRRIKYIPHFPASVGALAFSPDGGLLAVGVSPGFEEGDEDKQPRPELCKIYIRELKENEAKPRTPATGTGAK
ncbi:hypothetical protein M433DRAFT_153851 [Acidomyces richmondensis BFW]|nr:MAG: hypothetical protein FE78DRAFT_89733 [Acidomyces sp. 'richmondensis']KYG46031.1 hypothetical protein M433DRAFT_153851 [Acidomyces richmondensis BFW]